MATGGIVERNQTLKREDLSSLMTIVDQHACPFTSALKKGSAPHNSLQEWPLDSHAQNQVAAATYTSGSSNKIPQDGADVDTFEDFSARVKGSMYVQYARRQPKVSRLANMTSDVAGVGYKKEMANAISKALVAHKRDIEATISSAQECQLETATKPYQTRGIGKWIQTAAQGTLAVDSDFRTPATSIKSEAAASAKEESIRGVLQSIFDQTGDTSKSFYGLCGTTVKKTISEFTLFSPRTNNQVVSNRDTNSNRLAASVDIIESDFGTVTLNLSTFLLNDSRTGTPAAFDPTPGQKSLFILNMSSLELAFAENTNVRELPDLGGGPRSLIESVFALKSYSGGLDHGKYTLT
jgi:hypothetical protein